MESRNISPFARGEIRQSTPGKKAAPTGSQPADSYTPQSSAPKKTIDTRQVAEALLKESAVLSPEILWEFDLGSAIMSKPLIGNDGTIYVGTRYGSAYALDSATGEEKWKFTPKDGVFSSFAAGPDGLVYIPGNGKDRTLHVFDGATGEEKWNFDLEGEPGRSVGVGPDGTIYAGSSIFKPISKVASSCSHGMVYALDGKNGEKKWEFKTGDMVVSTPAPGPHNSIYFGTYDRMFYALDEQTGEKKWEFEAGGWISSTPAFSDDGKVYFGSWDSKIYALDSTNGEKLWQFETGGDVRGNPLVGPDGTVYTGSYDGFLYALDGTNGDVKWRRDTGNKVLSSPVIDKNGIIYVGNFDGKVYAYDSTTGAAKWQFQTEEKILGSPAVGPDGTVYIGNNRGKLYALDACKLESLVDKINSGTPGAGENDGSSIEIFDDFIIIHGVKLPRGKK